MNIKNFISRKFTVSTILLSSLILIQACETAPTAKLTVNIGVNGCVTRYETDLYLGEPVTSLEILDKVNDETEFISGCEIDELEYSFNISPVIAKIEFELDEQEVTAFIPMQKGVTTPKPFVDGNISLDKIKVRVDFPNGDPASLVGSYVVK